MLTVNEQNALTKFVADNRRIQDIDVICIMKEYEKLTGFPIKSDEAVALGCWMQGYQEGLDEQDSEGHSAD